MAIDAVITHDVLPRILYGTRIALIAGPLTCVIGAALGLITG